MKILVIIGLTLFLAKISLAQNDTLKVVNGEYSQYIYNEASKSNNFSYNYSNKWDFDGDNLKDSMFFIGNGGAHSYFYPKIILSSNGLSYDFTSVQIDMPYFTSIETLNYWKLNPSIQFVVYDFNSDGSQDIYLNFNNSISNIPIDWKKQSVKTKKVILDFSKKKLSVKDYR